MLTIYYTNKSDKLKSVLFTGQNTDQYMLKGNYIQYYMIDGKRVSFGQAMEFINNYLNKATNNIND